MEPYTDEEALSDLMVRKGLMLAKMQAGEAWLH